MPPKKPLLTKQDIIICVLLLLIGFAGGWFTKQYFTKPCPNVFTIKNGEILDSSAFTDHSKIETDWHIPQEVKTVIKKVPEYIIWDDDTAIRYDSSGIFVISKNEPQQYYYDTSTICKELSDSYNNLVRFNKSLLDEYFTERTYSDSATDKGVKVLVENKVKENKISGQRITILDSLKKTNIFNVQSFNKIIGYYGITGGWQSPNNSFYLGANLSLKLKNDNIVGLSAMGNNHLQMLYTAEYKHPIRLFKK